MDPNNKTCKVYIRLVLCSLVHPRGLKIYLKASFKIICYKYLAIKEDFVIAFNYFKNIKLNIYMK